MFRKEGLNLCPSIIVFYQEYNLKLMIHKVAKITDKDIYLF